MARSLSTCSMACSRRSLHIETSDRKNSDSTNHNSIAVRKGATGKGLDVSRMTASSIPSRKVRMRMRTFTSQVSQLRSSDREYMRFVVRRSEFGVRASPLANVPRTTSYELRTAGFLSRQFRNHREQRQVQ